MSMSVLINILKAIPTLITVLANFWEFLSKSSRGRPEQLLAEVAKISEEMRNAKTEDDQKAVARRISNLWAGVPDNKT